MERKTEPLNLHLSPLFLITMRLPAKKTVVSFLLFLLPFFLWAQEVAFQAIPLQTTVGVGRSFQVTYNLDNAGNVGGIELQPQSDFSVAPGYSDASRTSTQNINGRVQTTQTYSRTYTFQALREGTVNLPVAVATTSAGNTYRTAPVRMKVVGRNSAPAQQRPIDPLANDPFAGMFGGGGSSSDPFGDMQRLIERETLPSRESARQRSAMQVLLSKANVWVGEPVQLKYQVRTSVNMQPTGELKVPSAEGLWVEPIDKDQSAPSGDNTVYQILAIPLRAGTISIPAASLPVATRVVATGGYPERFEFTLVSPTQALNVRPLPLPQPAGFQGAVGRYEMASNLSTDSLEQGGAAILRIRLTGSGGLSQLEAPELQLPAGLTAGEPRVTDDIKQEGATSVGWREFGYTISAEEAGSFTIPPVAFAYFNPQTERYQTVQSRTYNLRVTPGLIPASEAGMMAEPVSPLRWTVLILILAGSGVFTWLLWLFLKQWQEKKAKTVPKSIITVSPVIEKTVVAPERVVPPQITTLQSALSVLGKIRLQLTAGTPLYAEVNAFIQNAEGFLYGGGSGTETQLFTEAMDLLRRTQAHLRA